MDYSRASRENTHTVQRMRMEKSGKHPHCTCDTCF
jgi:hypothetical protein